MISFISRFLDLRDKRYLVIAYILFLILSLIAVLFYSSEGLKASFKISIFVVFLLFGFLIIGNWRFFLLLYVLSIPISTGFVIFTPYYKNFTGVYIETQNICSLYSFLARPDAVYLYNILELMGLLVLLEVFLKREYHNKKCLYVFLLAFTMFSSLSIFTSINPFRAFIHLLHLSLSIVMFAIFLHYLGQEESFDRTTIILILITLFLVTASVLSKKAIINLLKGNFLQREQGRFGNPNTPGLLAGMGVLISAYLFFKEHSTKKIFYILGFALFFLIVLCTGSRNALISTVLSVSLFSFLGFRTKAGKKKDFILPSLLILAFIGFVVYLGKIIFILRLNLSLLRFDLSLWSRLVLWKNSIEYIIKNPFKPIGLGNFFYFEGSLGLPFAHNLFINTLIESGIVPFFMLVYAAFLGIKVIFRILGRGLKGEITVDEAIAASIFLYLILMFLADQFLYEASGWRYVLLILAFAISRIHKRPTYIK